jgi:ribose 5-phosphate isomerase B
VNPGLARQLVRVFLATDFAGGRHARRVQKIAALDEEGARRAPDTGGGA